MEVKDIKTKKISKDTVKVLEVIRQGKIGGGESHVLDLVKNLDKEFYHPVVLSFTDGPMVSQLKDWGIKVYVIPTETPFDFKVWNQVKRLMISEGISLVHAHGTRANTNVFWPAKQLNIPVIYTVHGWSFNHGLGPVKENIRRFSEKLMVKRSAITINVSNANLKDGLRLLGNYEHTLVNYGIDLTNFKFDGNYADLRKEFGFNDEHVVVGGIMRMTTQKDPVSLIKSFAKASQSDDQLRLLLVGDGELKNEVETEIENQNIADKVKLQPFRKDIPAVLNAIDIYFLPSLWEGLPIGMLEAMSMKKAILASDVDGSKEAIINGRNGILCKSKDIDAFAQGLLKYSTDPELRRAYGEEAYKTILEHFEVKKMTSNVQTVYDKILNNQ